MDLGSTFFYKYRRFVKTLKIYLLLAGPGLIVMLADNDAGGITTYTVTGAKFGYGLIWFLLLLYVTQQEEERSPWISDQPFFTNIAGLSRRSRYT
ncbi:MAG TPA: hypothetical protein VFC43_07460, partial [Methanoregula sp.]|nr:hypothetical protein [Methanoregula sp.]